MKTISRSILVLTIFAAGSFFTSCRKNCTGGNASIHALIYHNNTPVRGCTVFVKFGAKKEPSDVIGSYDLKLAGEVDDNHVHVEDLRPGDYYLYALGFDSIANVPVRGGTAVTISWSNRNRMKEVQVAVN